MNEILNRLADRLEDPEPPPTLWAWLLVAFAVLYVGAHLALAISRGSLL